MAIEKSNWTNFKELIQKVDCSNILKMFPSIILLFVAAFITDPVFAQNNKDTATSKSSSNGDGIFNQMIDYSRPGKYHQLFADLVGSWTFKGRHFSGNPDSNKIVFQFYGTAVRISFANGRFFIVNTTGNGKLQMPIQNGKMKEVNLQGIITEGYDNVKNKFIKTEISNHIGSDIAFFEGNYDSTTKTITFNGENELVPGIKTKVREVFIILDKNHYKLEYYDDQNGKYVKATEVNYTRVKGK